MAKLAMKKIEIISLLADSQGIIERLQRRGVVEPVNIEEENLIKMNVSATVGLFEKNLATVKEAQSILEKYSAGGASLFSSLKETLSGRVTYSTAKFAEEKEKMPEVLSFAGRVTEKAARLREIAAEREKLSLRRDSLMPWLSVEEPQNFKGTKTTTVFLGTLPSARSAEEWEAYFSEKYGVSPAVRAVSQGKGTTNLQALIAKAEEKAFAEALREEDFYPAPCQGKLSFRSEAAAAEKKEKALAEEKRAIEKDLEKEASRRRELLFLADALQMKIDKYRAVGEVAMTEKTMVLRGYVPAKYAEGLRAEFEEKYEVAILLSDPEEEEEPPVLLENGAFSAPLESITEMYALPGKKDVDPSPVMAFFYYLFFGMMLSDAGYGLLMTVGTVLVLKFFRPEETMKKTMRLFRNCGISTLIWGALFGSWFGDLPQAVAKTFFGVTEDFSTALWFEPIDDPIKLLLFSFGLGICHLFLGLGVSLWQTWKGGDRLGAVLDVVPVMLTVLGVAPLGAGILTEVPAILSQIGLYVMLAGAVLLILTAGRTGKNLFSRLFGGVYALYNLATGYLGDILSYSRLLALGLATGSIAGVINLIVTMPGNRVVCAVLLCTAGVVAHLANLAINLLGAYVHSDRLQFVELFSKFYEGGGKAFRPLKSDTKYFKFEKENIYHG